MKYYISLLFFVFVFNVNSQPQKRHEQIKAQKVAFITEKLQLTPNEAQRFWPIFNAFEEKMENIRKNELRSLKGKLHQSNSLSENEAKELLDNLISAETKMHNYKLNLISDLKNVISDYKILKLKVAEEQFKRKLLKNFRDIRSRKKHR